MINYMFYLMGKNTTHKFTFLPFSLLGGLIIILASISVFVSTGIGLIGLLVSGIPAIERGEIELVISLLFMVVAPFIALKIGLWLNISFGKKEIYEGYQKMKQEVEAAGKA